MVPFQFQGLPQAGRPQGPPPGTELSGKWPHTGRPGSGSCGPQRPGALQPSGPHKGWTSWALSHVPGAGGPPCSGDLCSGSRRPLLSQGQGRALATPSPGTGLDSHGSPAKLLALPGCRPEASAGGHRPGLCPRKTTRGSCVPVWGSGWLQPSPQRWPLRPGSQSSGSRSLGKAGLEGGHSDLLAREL